MFEKGKMIKIVWVIFIFVLTSKTVLSSAVRYGLSNFSSMNQTLKRDIPQKTTMDDPSPNNDFKTAVYSVKKGSKRLYSFRSAINTNRPCSVLNCIRSVPGESVRAYSGNFSDIVIPPKATF